MAITAPAGEEKEFAERVSGAMAAIDVADLGIAAMRPRRVITGGLVLEIRGAQGAARAAALKARLVQQLGGPGIKVHCPQKMAKFRVCGLTELASKEVVRGAVAARGGCVVEDVVVCERRRDTIGLFSLWARRPVAAAARLVKTAAITVDSLVAPVVPAVLLMSRVWPCPGQMHQPG